MASVVDVVRPDALAGAPLAPGAVLPLEHHASTARGLWPLGHGGALYLVAHDAHGRLWLVAVLEAPDQAGILRGDTRAPGWYAAPNVVPVTDITELREALRLTHFPAKLRPAHEQRVRELLDERDAPVVEAAVADPPPAEAVEGPPLARAAAHLAASAVTPAIAALLEAWRGTRAVELADLVDRASRCLPRFDHPLFVDRLDDSACAKTWDATLAVDPVGAMPQLLQNLEVGGGVAARLGRLAALPDDPRISRRLVELLPGAWATCLAIVERGRDAPSWQALVDLAHEITLPVDTGGDRSVDEVSLARSGALAFTATSPRAPQLTADDRGHLAAIALELDRLEATARTERELVDAIAEHPDDDGPRLIYADWLIERGHPRGEYLSLTLQQPATLSPASRRRLALLGQVPYLFGAIDDLATMLRRPRARGLDDRIDVYGSTPPAKWRAATHHPLVRLLREVRLVGEPRAGRADALAAFIRAAPRLERIDELDRPRAHEVLALLDGSFERAGDALVRVGRAGRAHRRRSATP